MENKKIITHLLFDALKATRVGEELESMKYVMDYEKNVQRLYKEAVVLTLKNGAEYVANVSYDSGLALILDVANQIVRGLL